MINSVVPSIEVARPCQWVVTYLWYLLKVNVSYWEGSSRRLHDYDAFWYHYPFRSKLTILYSTYSQIFFARCTCQLLLFCELCRWSLNSTFHNRFSFWLYLTDCYRTFTSFHLQTESNSLIEHNVSAAWCQWISKCVFFSFLSISIIFMENSCTNLPQLFFMLLFSVLTI